MMKLYIPLLCLLAYAVGEPPLGNSYSGSRVREFNKNHPYRHDLAIELKQKIRPKGLAFTRSASIGADYRPKTKLATNQANTRKSLLNSGYKTASARNSLNLEYGVPSSRNGFSQEYGVPSSRQSPRQEYGLPSARKLNEEYGLPNTNNQEYEVPIARNAPKQEYGVPAVKNNLNNEYGVPVARNAPNQEYGTPAVRNTPNQEYGVPAIRNTPNQEYGIPVARNTPNQKYGTPAARNVPNPEYGTPAARKTPNQDYGVPNAIISGLNQEYGVPKAQNAIPSSEYGLPSAKTSNLNQEYGAPARFASPNQEYGVPLTRNAGVSQEYGVPANSLSKAYGVPKTVPQDNDKPTKERVTQEYSLLTGVAEPYNSEIKAKNLSDLKNFNEGFSLLSNDYSSVSDTKTSARSSYFPGDNDNVKQTKATARNSPTYRKSLRFTTGSSKNRANAKGHAIWKNNQVGRSLTQVNGFAYPGAGEQKISDVYGAPNGDYHRGFKTSLYSTPELNVGYMYAKNSLDELHQEPVDYNFAYKVSDVESGSNFGHSESRQANKAEGSYYVVLPNGNKQIIDYKADEKGFKPRISIEAVEQTAEHDYPNIARTNGIDGPY